MGLQLHRAPAQLNRNGVRVCFPVTFIVDIALSPISILCRVVVRSEGWRVGDIVAIWARCCSPCYEVVPDGWHKSSSNKKGMRKKKSVREFERNDTPY